jgi:hypothetical protein
VNPDEIPVVIDPDVPRDSLFLMNPGLSHMEPFPWETGGEEWEAQVAAYAEKLRKRGCECGAGADAHPREHRPICPIRILNPPPWPVDAVTS